MISLKGKKIVDLTDELVARVARIDGSIEQGTDDAYGHKLCSEAKKNDKGGTW